MKGKLIKTEKFYVLKIEDIIGTNDDYFSTKLDHPYRLSTRNCEVIENGYDLDKLAEEEVKLHHTLSPKAFKRGIQIGFQKALKILGDKKFSEEDMVKVFFNGRESLNKALVTVQEAKSVIQSLQQTEWDVEIEMACVMGCQNLILNGKNSICCGNKEPKLDANGCLILKRV